MGIISYNMGMTYYLHTQAAQRGKEKQRVVRLFAGCDYSHIMRVSNWLKSDKKEKKEREVYEGTI